MAFSDALTSPMSYLSNTLGKALISVVRSVQVSINNMAYSNNWKLESDYGSRAQLIHFDQFYGQFNIGSINVTNHKGINNKVVTSTLGASISPLTSSDAAYYGSQYPFFRFENSDIAQQSTLALGTNSEFSNLGFW